MYTLESTRLLVIEVACHLVLLFPMPFLAVLSPSVLVSSAFGIVIVGIFQEDHFRIGIVFKFVLFIILVRGDIWSQSPKKNLSTKYSQRQGINCDSPEVRAQSSKS